jgi:hypothetical protein
MALRPFFITSSTASAISFLALHLTQYPSGITCFRTSASGTRQRQGTSLRGSPMERQLDKGF